MKYCSVEDRRCPPESLPSQCAAVMYAAYVPLGFVALFGGMVLMVEAGLTTSVVAGADRGFTGYIAGKVLALGACDHLRLSWGVSSSAPPPSRGALCA